MTTPTCQKFRTESWSSIFPADQVTEQQSALFVKKLLAVSVSSVAYLRALFPEYAFGDRSLEDITLKILKNDSACEGACQVIKWIKGCFDALEKKYLRQVLIGIYEDAEDPDTVIEQYAFKIQAYEVPNVISTIALYVSGKVTDKPAVKFHYNNEGSMDIYRNGRKIMASENETKKATIKLLRTIIMLSQTLAPLPDDVMMTMKLLYYDDVTPSDYQPTGFKDCDTDMFNFSNETMNIKVGDVNAPFHSMKLRIRTGCHQLQYKEDEDEEEQDMEEKIFEDEENKSQGLLITKEMQAEEEKQEEQRTIEGDDADSQCGEANLPGNDGISTTENEKINKEEEEATQDRFTPVAATSVDNQIAKCPCGVNEDDGLMILCAYCDTWQHAFCFAINDPENAPETHICVDCAKSNPDVICTDPTLVNLEEVALQDTCLWRRALQAALETPRVLDTTMAKRLGVELYIASQIIKRLLKEGYARQTPKGKRLGKVVLKERVKNHAIPKYFDISLKDANRKIDDKPTEDTNEAEAVKEMIDNASKLHISHTPLPAKSNEGKLNEENIEKENIEPKRGKKRARSKINEDAEFDIADSQDVYTESQRSSKRRKSSVTTKSILV